ncbi:helix-turn-helix domain-containing protein [bacterium endosymbiont of Bathymodiolus sp. 5 South]|jgi:IS30 family transposase|uniref:helix-turn-helix domain-containing protein n=1 Tax=bacterium endosymbiont of Bathymodiolus sp. 5 South TaxID=1181670 RepID=UPI0010B86EDC|nr:helix-turn-helix domain-containing protein [bacterium endosymbiont of Bathymodiolus sp. 5 South]CAC9640826.1 hypothetical protein [uncultured Gammaproteobacteria bacterium]CAC9646532.1 hypothetical protein [uncultured Gammaproteobacteria bacterium]SHN90734.1 hypothetical protein BCLUESOX_937 [bacterium endosymbiont of Bathymodiolus sp. 5 South]SSC06963.1 Mobile element protein [bacterium endosymbiont of Bathymodiolus sp. 5 South]VVH57630.1 hypothetical protein BSPCLSOX_2292 [uncultured Gamm
MYKHLTSEERHYIAIGIKQGMSKNKIAQHLNRSHSTIIKEIKHNTGKRGYRYNQADGFAQQRHQAKSRLVKLTIECKHLIDNCLNLDWLPEQVCGWLKGRSYRKRYGYAHNRTDIPNRVDIDQRPEAVNNREVFGHWEADTIIGKAHTGTIVTLDERISKLRLAYPLNSKWR